MSNSTVLNLYEEICVTLYDLNHNEIPSDFFEVDSYGDEITIQLKSDKYVKLFQELFKEAELKGQQYVDFLNDVNLKLELLGKYVE
jgi:hypothetical protein